MRILAVDTSTDLLCLGVYCKGEFFDYTLNLGRKNSALLAVTIKRVLDTLGLKAGDFDYFACGSGPGSFTGIRVGFSTMKALAWSVKKPFVGVPGLDLLASNALDSTNGYIVPLVDARREMVYYAIYKAKGGRLKRLCGYRLSCFTEAVSRIAAGSTVLGNGLALYKEAIRRDISGVRLLDKDYWPLQPRNLIRLALERIKRGAVEDPARAEPVYLYPKECQVRKLRRTRDEGRRTRGGK